MILLANGVHLTALEIGGEEGQGEEGLRFVVGLARRGRSRRLGAPVSAILLNRRAAGRFTEIVRGCPKVLLHILSP
ncbi:MAG: hypothetical protein ACK44W_03965 [Planctomycetota bacterium]